MAKRRFLLIDLALWSLYELAYYHTLASVPLLRVARHWLGYGTASVGCAAAVCACLAEGHSLSSPPSALPVSLACAARNHTQK